MDIREESWIWCWSVVQPLPFSPPSGILETVNHYASTLWDGALPWNVLVGNRRKLQDPFTTMLLGRTSRRTGARRKKVKRRRYPLAELCCDDEQSLRSASPLCRSMNVS